MSKTKRDFERAWDLKTAERLLSYQRRAKKAQRSRKRKESIKKYWSKVRAELSANPSRSYYTKRKAAIGRIVRGVIRRGKLKQIWRRKTPAQRKKISKSFTREVKKITKLYLTGARKHWPLA